MGIIRIRTWRDVKEWINGLSEEQLSSPAQIVPPSADADAIIELQPMICAGTIEELYHVDGDDCAETRSSSDNEHHPEHLAIAVDHNLFDEDGSIAINFHW